MSNRPALKYGWSPVALAVTGLSLAGFAMALGNGDRLVAGSFSSALVAGEAAAPSAARPAPALAQLSGSEDFWLNSATRVIGTVPATWVKPVTVGDRIAISTGGQSRQLEVIDVREIGGPETGAEHRVEKSERLLMITCRDADAPGARLVRFVIESADGTGVGHGSTAQPNSL